MQDAGNPPRCTEMQAADRRLSAANIANDHLDRLGELLEPFRHFKKLPFDAGVG